MKLTVVSFDDRHSDHVDMVWNMNRAYCDARGYRFETHRVYRRALPPWWVKVFLIRDYVQATDDDRGWFLWLDSDAFLRAELLPIETFLASVPDTCSFVGGYDPLGRAGSFNAGAFAVRISAAGREVMDVWAGSFDESAWVIEHGAWRTAGAWAGICYEQGAFNRWVLGHPGCRGQIRLYGNDFVSFDFDGAGFIKHFPVHLRPRVEAAYRLYRADHASVMCMHFGGEYHELVRSHTASEYLLRWPLRFPISTCTKHDEPDVDIGYWKWRHDGSTVNGWVQCLPDGRIKSSWFGLDGWWYRRTQMIACAS